MNNWLASILADDPFWMIIGGIVSFGLLWVLSRWGPYGGDFRD